MDWTLNKQSTLFQCPPFSVEELQFTDNATQSHLLHSYYRIAAPSWVNVLALTPEREAILVRQPRAGMLQTTLEIPGGNMEKNELPEYAVRRELEEETGYRAGQIRHLGTISPNPAIMSNRLHMYLAIDCTKPSKREHFPDAMEQIVVETLPLPELERLLLAGEFPNALGALTLLMALRYASIDS